MVSSADARPPVIFLMGPTASGKTGLAVELVQRLPLEIVSVDSALVYRGMDIGTAKPDAATLAAAPHRLIDIRDPAETYSAADFRADALREIEAIHARGHVPLLVGGTMLYFQALESGLAALPAADTAVRERLEQQAADVGWPGLHRRLAEADPETAARLHPNDAQRIQRALEVLALTGRPLSSLLTDAQAPGGLAYPCLKLVVTARDRALLHERIATRFRAMLAQGLIDEVAALKARGDLHAGLPSMRSVGYRQVWTYLEGHWDRETLEHKGIVATRQFAKRQMTWLRRSQGAEWSFIEDGDPVSWLASRCRSLTG
ncbi:tRNA (adenosine(37)-N6)-dimethylallyltransferase MiaA [Ectothiorhodospiraceae bacterium WFHF3C12]|nr:tRNA (adenosine(37)-N6)-dimethylallyltransferase MiaA [Ectothiorhodospiraceae bacterium WFHF3C12]